MAPNNLIKNIVAGVGALAVMMLLDWILPGGSVLSTMLNLSWEKIKYIGIGLVVLVIVIIGIVGYGISEAEGKWEFKRLYETFRRLVRNRFLDKADKILAQTGANRQSWHKNRVLPDIFPDLLKNNIVYLFSLNNYLKRYYIWLAKSSQVTYAEHTFSEVLEWIGGLSYYYGDYDSLLEDIQKIRNKGTIQVRDDKGEKVIGTDEVGLFSATRELITAFNEAIEIVAGVRGAFDYNASMSQTIPKNVTESFKSEIKEVEARINAASSKLNKSIKYLETRAKAFGDFQIIRAWMFLCLDQDNPYGAQEHQYLLIPPKTALIDQFGNKTTAPHELEVNMYGEVLEDVNSNKDQFYDTLPLSAAHIIRRVSPQDILLKKIKPMNPPFEIMSLIGNDWQGGFRNMRFGRFRKYSKAAKNYIDAMSILGKEDFYNESNIPFPDFVVKDEEHAAFDRRAAIDTGVMYYAGRKNMHQTFPEVEFNDDEDPYPAVSTLGISAYLTKLIEKDTENMKEMNKYTSRFLKDIGEPVSSTKDAPRTFKALGGEEEAHGR